MRKCYTVLTGIFFVLLFATCKQFTTDIDEYLSYWAAEAFIKSSNIEAATQTDITGMVSVASANDVTVTLKVQNPKSFRFVMPSSSETRNIVNFAHLTGATPAVGTDYELKQIAGDTLNLIYKAGFLKNYEWGRQDLSSTIKLYADDGRPFKQTFTVNIKANTPPPLPVFTVAKTAGTPAYYVLCIRVPEMDAPVQGGLLHKDLTRIEINGTSYALSVNEKQHTFVKPEDGNFITAGEVERIPEPDASPVPAGGWILYYKTDVEVKEGAVKKEYTVRLADAGGLVSQILNASTKPNKAEHENIHITKGNLFGGSGSESNPVVIGTNSEGAELAISSPTANTTVHCTVSEIGGSVTRYNGNPVTIPLPLNGAGEKKYKLEYYTDGEGFAATPVKTVYYRIAVIHTVTFDANGGTYEGGATAVSKTALHGTAISEPNPLPKKTGYGLTGWYKDAACSAGQAWNSATDTVTGDMTLYAQWTAGVVSYKVEHYKEKLDGTYPDTADERVDESGTTGQSAVYNQKTYEGFTYQSGLTEINGIQQSSGLIAGDRSTVVKLYYQRNTITVTFKLNGGKVDGNTSDVTQRGKYGAPLSAPTASWTGHRFSGWNPPLSAGSTFPAEENTEYTARWDLNSYLVTYTVDGAGGKIKIGSGNPTTNSTISVTHGGNVTFTADPDTGYEVEKWMVGGNEVSGNTSTSYELSTVTEAKTVTVKFKKTVYTVRFIVYGGRDGTLKAKPEGGTEKTTSTTDTVSVEYGKKVTFTADPAEGYEVESWTGATADHSNSTTATLLNVTTDNINVMVKFKKKTYTVTFSIAAGEGQLRGEGGVYVDMATGSTPVFLTVQHGGSATFTATPTASGSWKIAGWTKGADAVNGTNSTYTLSNVTSDTTVTVKFYQSEIDGTASMAWRALLNAVSNAPANATIKISGTIQATSDGGNNGEIVINKNLTIKKADGASSAVIDANKGTGSKPKHRIFKVESGKTLTLDNLTLKGG
ncbi:MAG: InlB B-repeat-containing protein, partial [Treponema sp.]|uniref:InlB B-repeat-containing protein n=1 Tax=Treponema sp. TaxID=166 RepID=UPI003FA22A46